MTFIWQKKKKKEFFERTMATDGNRRYSLEADLKMNQTNSSWQPLPSSSWTIFQPQHDIWWSSKTVHNLINMRNISLFNITQTSPNKSWQGGRPPNWGLSLNRQNFLPPVHITSANLIRLSSNFSLNNIIFFHKGKFAHIDQTRLSPVMICNKLVHFANVFFGVSTGGASYWPNPRPVMFKYFQTSGDNISCFLTSGTISFCQLDTVGSFQMCCGWNLFQNVFSWFTSPGREPD